MYVNTCCILTFFYVSSSRNYRLFTDIKKRMTNMFNSSDTDRLLNSCEGMKNSESSFDNFRLDQDHDQSQTDKNYKNGSFESSLASSFSEASSAMDNAIMSSLPCMMLSTDRIHLEQWKWSYRGEGAANLVISLQVRYTFLRLNKILKKLQCLIITSMKSFFLYNSVHRGVVRV